MKIKRMTATFGRLQHATLDLTAGLNILEAPNEGGKSTWCAFLRAMLYGVPTKERDRAGYLAEKNRYQPWSGAPMEGTVDLTWGGRDITLRRGQKGSTPFGGFEAVDSKTGEPIPALTADNAGEVLLGVPREVYERSAFVGQSSVSVDGSAELEKRIAALVSSGEEDVSFSQTERRLKDWLNRRKHNKSGLIPKLEGELEELDALLNRMDRVGRSLAEAQGERESLAAREARLAAEQGAQAARIEQVRRAEYEKATDELKRCRAELNALLAAAGALPNQEALLAAQGDLAYYNTLGANLKIAENDAAATEGALREAREAARDPLFDGMTAEAAQEKAANDRNQVEKTPQHLGGHILSMVSNALLAFAWAVQAYRGADSAVFFLVAFLLLGVANVWQFLRSRKRRSAAQAILTAYAAASPEGISWRANTYRDHCRAVESAEQRARAVSDSIRQMSAQREELIARLLDLVHPFADTVTDAFGVSAALSKALSLNERLATARVKLEGAQRLVSSIPAPSNDSLPPLSDLPPSDHTPRETAAMLAAVRGELGRVESAIAMARGERNTLGDADELEHRRSAAAEELERRGREYEALQLALESLGEANNQLRARFSPALNQRAGEIFAALTGGRYEDVALDRGFEAAAREAGGVLPRRALSLSKGTVDQLYLAVRLAVCEMALSAEEAVPLVLDDALSDFDDERMALALEYLSRWGQDRQILLFTCHSREKAHLLQKTVEGR